MKTGVPADRSRSLLPGIALLLLCGLIAGIAFPMTVTLSGMQDGDGMLTALISTQNLTWYFWGQDRLLNVLPALTHPFTNVETNLRLQVMMRAMLAYLAPLGVLVFLTRELRLLVIAVAIANVVVVTCLAPYALFNFYVQHNTAGTSLVMLAATYALTYSRLPKPVMGVLVVLTLCVAYAANFALLTYALPMIVLIGLLKREERKRHALFLAANFVAILVARLHSSYFGEPSTSYGMQISWDALVAAGHSIHTFMHLFTLATFAVVAGLCYPYAREKRPWEIAAAVSIGLGLVVLLANTYWVQKNGYDIRYFITAQILITSVIGYLIAQALLSLNLRYGLVVALCIAALANCVAMGLGGYNGYYKELVSPTWRAQSAAVADVAVAQNVRVIAGGFWDVWAAVYQTKREQRSRPKYERMDVYGATFRGEVLREQFLASVLGKGEQNALCFYTDVNQCLVEINARFHLPPDYTLTLKKSEAVQILSLPMLKLVFEVN
ncbi:hypothetical protein SAMN05216593_11969 [Pseudomonas asturiensis]|uniref:Glucosyl transferase GtrII n=1 Tax=Pseudomonas asturiensis TaxID=1190415 RepID=A0A1M7Q7U4_9PSED|nr:hypothetical protein [Pseudomonas asturiensis]SHN26488.1 hypothetical protein SAMN05216593_11969 [Pseudomonas asturiensis]